MSEDISYVTRFLVGWDLAAIICDNTYSISQEICTRVCCALLCCGYVSFIMNSHEVFIHIHQGCFAGTGAIVRLPQCQWSKPDGYGKISQCITTTKHSKAKPWAYFLGYTVEYSYNRVPDVITGFKQLIFVARHQHCVRGKRQIWCRCDHSISYTAT